MKKFYISILAVAAMTFAACNKEQHIDEPVQDVVENNYPVLKAMIDPETKMALDGTQLSFEVGDRISVFNGIVTETVTDETTGEETVTETGDRHGHTLYECTAVEAGVATFEWMESNAYKPAPEVDIVATYPNRGASTSAFEPEGEAYGEGTVKIRMVATADKAFDARTLPVIASATKGQMLQFKHTAGLLELNLKGTQTIKKVAITSDKIISGDASVRYADEEPVLNVVGAGTSNDYTITYTYLEPVVLSEEGVKLYFGLPAGTHNLTFTFTDSEGKVMRKTAKGINIERAKITTSTLQYSGDLGVNLSPDSKYANCYVVTLPGTYMFDTKKPNGEEVTGTSADWVWASGEAYTSTTASNTLSEKMMTGISYSDGKVFFTVPSGFQPGNVVLGLIDANNGINYTWHIWLSASNIEDITSSGVTVMDRNIGAAYACDPYETTSNTPWQHSKGTYYQWGRKDPFLGARNGGNEKTTAFKADVSQRHAINTSLNVTGWSVAAEGFGITQESGAANPLTMAPSQNVPGIITDDTSTSWCDRTNANPCPYGYRVISKSEFTALIDATATIQSEGKGTFATIVLAGGVNFPRAGYRGASVTTVSYNNESGESKVDNTQPGGIAYGSMAAYYFLNDAASDGAHKGSRIKFEWNRTANAYGGTNMYYADYKTYAFSTLGAHNASSVRCVRVAK